MPPDDIVTSLRKSPDASKEIFDLVKPKQPKPKQRHLKNIIPIVVTPKKTKRAISHPDKNYPLSQVNLIKLTRKLAEEAEKGTLKGLGGFAEYEDGHYNFGLEGYYLSNPSAAALPLLQLQGRVMDAIKEQEE